MAEKNLFPYDLAVVAIFKDEARYLREWLDYHLLAGVEHFYLYDNGSTDNFAEMLAPYVAGNLVTLKNFPGKMMQYPAYDDALTKFRFQCRYMAFIDCDEFIFPKAGGSIADVADEIFLRDPNVAALGINWQIFGSNGLQAADYSRGVLERFTRRAQSDWCEILSEDEMIGNTSIKSIVNPRRVECFWSPHYAQPFRDFYSVNSNGAKTLHITSHPVAADKIVINHYHTKSLEEFAAKVKRGSACRPVNHRRMEFFRQHDRNEIFDDGILKYRARRAEIFSLEDDAQRIARVKKFLVETLTQRSPFDAPPEFFVGKLETFLTCRALAESFDAKIGSRSAEEFALAWIYRTLIQDGVLTYADLQLLTDSLPEIFSRPFPLAKTIRQIFSAKVLPAMIDAAKNFRTWKDYNDLLRLQRLLNSI